MDETITTKERIVDGARELFSKVGYAKAKTDDIAKQIGISKRTLYENFSSKKELFNYVINEWVDGIRDMKDKIDNHLKQTEDLAAAINEMYIVENKTHKILTSELMYDLKRLFPELYTKVTDEMWENFKETFYEIVSIGKKKGYFKENVHPDILYWTIHKAQQYMSQQEVIVNLPFTLYEVHKQVDEIIFTGALTKKGKEEYKRLESNSS